MTGEDRVDDRHQDTIGHTVGQLDREQRHTLLDMEAGIIGLSSDKHGDQEQQTHVGEPRDTLALLNIHIGRDIRLRVTLLGRVTLLVVLLGCLLIILLIVLLRRLLIILLRSLLLDGLCRLLSILSVDKGTAIRAGIRVFGELLTTIFT